MKIVCNSSLLIFLSKLQKLDILQELFEKVYIPKAVSDEIVNINNEDSISIELRKRISQKTIEVFNVKNEIAVKGLIGRLHHGEVEVIRTS